MQRKPEGMGREKQKKRGERNCLTRVEQKETMTTEVLSNYVCAVLHNCALQDFPSYIPSLVNDFINTAFLYLESQPPKHM